MHDGLARHDSAGAGAASDLQDRSCGGLLRDHLAARPNLRTANTEGSPWLFPSTRAGQHLHPNTIMIRLRDLGIDLLGTRNTTLRDLVRRVPAPILATQLGYSHQATQRHAELAAQPMSRYVAAKGRGR